ncbi:hypothetical protein [Petropleomorpha daqingensis]|uniref:Uncharacterized protein n=1 Tax=Petropleomorpha daqingensis TaxID=2026353 RepID=A0A853CN33_9ACTN|nr:hypothetical protein [Petropleomorpha daqingensis]NYJ08601.1 hypothetical protein [Petropleomorpha daqingensis]
MSRLLRAAAAVQAAWGLALAAAPARTAALTCAGRPEPRAWIVRVLGLRLLVQSVWVLLSPNRSRVLGASAVDAVHAASMAGVAARWPRYRWAAAVSGTTAAASSALGVLLAPDARP